jgi:hypothetical protein
MCVRRARANGKQVTKSCFSKVRCKFVIHDVVMLDAYSECLNGRDADDGQRGRQEEQV